MTELFDLQTDKETLPRFHITSKHCFIVASLALVPTMIGVAIAEGDINLSSVASLISMDGSERNQEESFCENIAKHSNNQMAGMAGRVFCGHPPKPPSSEPK